VCGGLLVQHISINGKIQAVFDQLKIMIGCRGGQSLITDARMKILDMLPGNFIPCRLSIWLPF